jgi:hypothetical protein
MVSKLLAVFFLHLACPRIDRVFGGEVDVVTGGARTLEVVCPS